MCEVAQIYYWLQRVCVLCTLLFNACLKHILYIDFTNNSLFWPSDLFFLKLRVTSERAFVDRCYRNMPFYGAIEGKG